MATLGQFDIPFGAGCIVRMVEAIRSLGKTGFVAGQLPLDPEGYAMQLYWSMEQFPSINAWLVVRTAAVPDTEPPGPAPNER